MTGTIRCALLVAAALFVGALVAPAGLAAQESTTVTGCLSKGDAGTFSITGEDGTSYELAGSDVPLEGHQGHKVTITGALAGIETGVVAGAATDTGMARDTSTAADTGMAHGEMGHEDMKHEEMKHEAGAHDTAKKKAGGTLNVTSMSMVSASCS